MKPAENDTTCGCGYPVVTLADVMDNTVMDLRRLSIEVLAAFEAIYADRAAALRERVAEHDAEPIGPRRFVLHVECDLLHAAKVAAGKQFTMTSERATRSCSACLKKAIVAAKPAELRHVGVLGERE